MRRFSIGTACSVALHLAVPLVLAVSLCAHPLLGQEKTVSEESPLAAQVQETARIRVTTADGRLILDNPRISGSTVTYSAGSLPFVDIQKIQIPSYNPTKGALIGAGVGAAVGVIGLVAINSCSGFLCGPVPTGEAFRVIGVSAAIGAFFGTVIDLLKPGWKTIYER